MTSVHTFFCPCSNGVAGGRDEEEEDAVGVEADRADGGLCDI
jgi:hypothetical protein